MQPVGNTPWSSTDATVAVFARNLRLRARRRSSKKRDRDIVETCSVIVKLYSNENPKFFTVCEGNLSMANCD